MFSAPSSDTPEKLEFNLLKLDEAKTVTYYDGATNHILIDGFRQVTVNEAVGTAVVKLHAYSEDVSFNGTVTINVTD